jgi:hypothetical protein
MSTAADRAAAREGLLEPLQVTDMLLLLLHMASGQSTVGHVLCVAENENQ